MGAGPSFMQALAQAQAGQTGIVRVPSAAERDEVARVQGMQVRTNAVGLAANLYAGKDCTDQRLIATAKVIEMFILGEPPGTT